MILTIVRVLNEFEGGGALGVYGTGAALTPA
jgi:hypothetical protein